jgi:hypothetical protein
MGVVSATFGGVIRDILGGESPLILRKEVYVTPALALHSRLVAAGLPARAGRGGSGEIGARRGRTALNEMRCNSTSR